MGNSVSEKKKSEIFKIKSGLRFTLILHPNFMGNPTVMVKFLKMWIKRVKTAFWGDKTWFLINRYFCDFSF